MSKVRVSRVLGEAPPLTDQQRADLEALSRTPDSEIDYTDIPPTPEGWFKHSREEGRKLFRPLKVQKTLRLDADVLQWFEKAGPGYQTRINEALREYIAAHMD
jgi:uncharacterized protein (DUF4415 family)